MITRKVALVSKVKDISLSDLSRVGAALQKQVQRDFAPHWGVDAIVSAFARLEDVPIDYWVVKIIRDVKDAAGFHEDEDGQPFALVEAGAGWTVTASHEVLEMLADPWGKNVVSGPSPKKGQGRVRFLVEVCDPSEESTYTVNGIEVSDFYLPAFFDPVVAPGARYSFTGVIQKPRQVLKGGYLSWQVISTRSWWQEQWFDTAKPVFEELGLFEDNSNIRSRIDGITGRKQRLAKAKSAARTRTRGKTEVSCALQPDEAAHSRAASLRKHIDRIVAAK